jgi:hypothetical protein
LGCYLWKIGGVSNRHRGGTRVFSIEPWIDSSELEEDKKKTSDQLIEEMEKQFYFKDAVTTTIILNRGKPQNTVEFRTHDGMFATIHAVLFLMLVYERREETPKEIIDIVNNNFGWDFPESLLPYMKQLIYKALVAHDLRAPEDRPRRSLRKPSEQHL